MSKQQAKRIFEKNNPASDVIRCPYGRAGVRKQLDLYAKAAVNLYGIISRKELVELFNEQNNDQTTEEEMYILLLPLIRKEGWYCFYGDYIAHYWAIEDSHFVEYMQSQQEGKPRYLPEKEEFLNYSDEWYQDESEWWDVRKFMYKAFDYSPNVSKAFEELRAYMMYGDGISELGPILEMNHLFFEGEKDLKTFIDLLFNAKNNTRMMENKGYTPSELFEVMQKQRENVIDFPVKKRVKVGRNDPCPCGSGKKYKKCCMLIDESKTAQLSASDCRLFYETWYGLMGYVNEIKNVVKARIKPVYPNQVSDMLIHRVREVLWDNPELISDYLNETELPQEKRELLESWRDKHQSDNFIVMAYQTDYAVMMGTIEGRTTLYGVKGISNSVSNIVQKEVPYHVTTVLLPFKDKIIYDSYLATPPLSFGKGTLSIFQEEYDKALKEGNFLTSL